MLHEDRRFKHICVSVNPPRTGKDYNEKLLCKAVFSVFVIVNSSCYSGPSLLSRGKADFVCVSVNPPRTGKDYNEKLLRIREQIQERQQPRRLHGILGIP